VSGLHINTLLRNDTLFLSAQLPCVVVFNNPDKTGSERLTVSLSALLETIKQKGGSGSMVLYQVHPSVCTDLFAASKDGTILRRGCITRQENASDSRTLPRMKTDLRATVPVEMFRRELAYANGVAKQDTKKVKLRVCAMPGDNLLLQIEAVGVGGAPRRRRWGGAAGRWLARPLRHAARQRRARLGERHHPAGEQFRAGGHLVGRCARAHAIAALDGAAGGAAARHPAQCRHAHARCGP
jgi:hypothetical protein